MSGCPNIPKHLWDLGWVRLHSENPIERKKKNTKLKTLKKIQKNKFKKGKILIFSYLWYALWIPATIH